MEMIAGFWFEPFTVTQGRAVAALGLAGITGWVLGAWDKRTRLRSTEKVRHARHRKDEE